MFRFKLFLKSLTLVFALSFTVPPTRSQITNVTNDQS
jgi:hypothetical protein